MERKPLAPRVNTGSRLPVPGSRTKRALSPGVNETPVVSNGKKRCLERKPPATVGLRKQVSSVSVSSSKTIVAPRLASTKSSGNLLAKKPVARPPVARGVAPATRSGAATAPRPVQSKPSNSSASSVLNSTIVSTGAPKLKKRPAWDLKGRLQDMETQMQNQSKNNTNLECQLTEYNFRIANLESINKNLKNDVEEKQMASQSAVLEIEELKKKLQTTEEEYTSQKKRLQQQLDDLEFDKASLNRQKSSLEGELEASVKEVNTLKATVAEVTSRQALLQAELETTKQLYAAAQQTIKARDESIVSLNNTVEEKDKIIAELQAKDRAHETERRKLHNTIQELKGNIRVFCRVRPLLGDEELGNNGIISHMTFPDVDQKVLELDKLTTGNANESMLNSTRGGGRGASKYEFNFDKVFQPETVQSEVFEEISQLVQSALDGYNVCIFAYGQTGSGKTYTMEGCLDEESSMGMIPRTVMQIFKAAHDLQDKGWVYKFGASMLEIYNENLYDLLAKTSSSREEKLEIKLVGKGEEVHVPKLVVTDVRTESQVLNLLKQASQNRSVAETKSNSRSSRSHSVFQLRLEGRNSLTGESSKGLLNLVDLAGSERVKDSGSEGQRLVEAQAINKSLSNLGNVIMSLGNKDKHVPYRNSKLTYLLQNSLGGNSKTLMFVNVSPKEECFNETLNSLRFATKVNQCNIGTAQKKS